MHLPIIHNWDSNSVTPKPTPLLNSISVEMGISKVSGLIIYIHCLSLTQRERFKRSTLSYLPGNKAKHASHAESLGVDRVEACKQTDTQTKPGQTDGERRDGGKKGER